MSGSVVLGLAIQPHPDVRVTMEIECPGRPHEALSLRVLFVGDLFQVAEILMMASVGLVIFGTSRSSKRTSRGP